MQFASGGVGSASHLTCAGIDAAIGVEVTHVTYRGSAQAMQDLFAGRIDYYCALAAAAVGPLESKHAKVIAILTRDRSPLFPGLASANEQGIKGLPRQFLERAIPAQGRARGYRSESSLDAANLDAEHAGRCRTSFSRSARP